mgnify:FL=1
MVRILATPRSQHGNPYCRLLYDEMERQGCVVDEYRVERLLAGDYDIWHLHWPEGFFQDYAAAQAAGRIVTFVVLLVWAWCSGTRVVWTLHNLEAHENRHPVLEDVFWRVFPRLVHATISLSEQATCLAVEKMPALRQKPSVVIPHGHYRPVYPRTMTPTEARERLGFEPHHRVGLYFGSIREYKNVPALLRSFRSVRGPDRRLLVVGNPHTNNLRDRVQEEADQDPRATAVLRFVPEEAVQQYFLAADLAVVPQREFLNSGSALLALSFDRPVLAARQGSMIDVQEHVGTECVRLFENKLTAHTLGKALKWADQPRPNEAPLDDLSWVHLARRTRRFFQRL